MKQLNGGKGAALATQTVISRTWGGLPGYALYFPVSISLSGDMATEREKTIGLSAKEKSGLLLDFRIRLIADVLTDAPYMLNLEKLPELRDEKAAASVKAENERRGGLPEKTPLLTQDEIEQIYAETKLTENEVKGHYEPLPGWSGLHSTMETPNLYDLAYAFFNRDENGRKPYALLIEDVTAAFWDWATPRPIISVSAFMQDTQATSIKG